MYLIKNLPPEDLRREIAVLARERPHLAELVMRGDTTFTNGDTTFALEGSPASRTPTKAVAPAANLTKQVSATPSARPAPQPTQLATEPPIDYSADIATRAAKAVETKTDDVAKSVSDMFASYSTGPEAA